MTKQTRPAQTAITRSDAHNGSEPTQDAIGRRLREYYDEVVNEPVPDDFMDLLSQLDRPDEEDSDDAR